MAVLPVASDFIASLGASDHRARSIAQPMNKNLRLM
jgi:hypothetical protein